jgi:hypothetical protein
MFRKASSVLLVLLMISLFGFADQAKTAKEQDAKERSSEVQKNSIAQRIAATQSYKNGAPLNEGFEGGAIPLTWTVYNFDGDAKEWIAENNSSNAHSGDWYASVSWNAAGNNDWLITPALIPATGDSIIFWARSRSATWPEDFNVRLSTTGTDSADFSVTLEQVRGLSTDYTKFAYSLDAYVGDTIYVAVQCVSVDKFSLWVDDFTGPEVYLPPGGTFTTPLSEINLNETNSLVPVGESASTQVYITNTGGSDLNITAITPSSTDITTNVSSLVIPAGATDSVEVTWTPSTVGVDTQTVTFTHDGTKTDDVVTLYLQSVPAGSYVIDFERPVAEWTVPAGYGLTVYGVIGSSTINQHWGNRGNWWSGTSWGDTSLVYSPRLDLTSGPTEMSFYYKGVTGGDDSVDVAVTTDNGATWTTVATVDNNGSNWRYIVIDLSAYAGNDNVMVRWDYRHPTGQTTGGSWYMDDLALPSRYTGTTGILYATPEVVDFGSVTLGESDSANVTLSNTGQLLTINSITSNNPNFTVSNVPNTIGTLQTADFTITFTPSFGGNDSATITIDHDGVNGKTTLDLTARGFGFVIPTNNVTWNEPFASTSFSPLSWDLSGVAGNPEIIDETGVASGTFPYDLPSEPYMMEISGETGVADDIATGYFDLSGLSDQYVSFWKSEHDLELGEYVLVWYYANDMSWKLLDSLAGTNNGFGVYEPFELVSYPVPADGYHSQFRLRFTASDNMASTDEYYFDNIRVGTLPPPPTVKLLITEIVITPTDGEYVEIYNPSSDSVNLSNYYLTDATFQGGNVYYYQVVEGGGGGGGFGDFNARFPDGAMIAPGEYQTVALAGDSAFFATYGVLPTYELYEDGHAVPADVPDMREAVPGSVNGQGGLTNGDEVVILYNWDGESDLVVDIDYLLYNSNSPIANNEFVDKTGVRIDGPDADTDSSEYQPDTPEANQRSAPNHSFGFSLQRVDMTEGAQVTSGGNGVDGRDETSEDLDNTFVNNAPPTPNSEYVPLLAAPTNLTAVGGNGVVSLSWLEPGMLEKLLRKTAKEAARADKDNAKALTEEESAIAAMSKVNALTGYKIYRSEDNVTFTSIDSIGAPANMYDDSTVTNGTTYYYYVTATYDEGESDPSNVVMVTPTAAVVLFEEVFGDTLPPAGWQVVDNDGSGSAWDFRQAILFTSGDTVLPQAGQSFWFSNFNNANSSGLIDEWLISPQIPAANFDKLTFYAGSIGSIFPDSLKVLVSTTGTNPGDFVEIAYVLVPGPTGSWHEFTFDISAFSGSPIYVAVNYYIVDGGPTGNNSDNVWVDHFIVTGEQLPVVGLNPPRNLHATGGESKVDLEWVAPLPPGELGYDDGTVEQGFGFQNTGEFAVRFTPNVYPSTLLAIKAWWVADSAALNNVEYGVWVNPTGGDAAPTSKVLGNVPYTVPARDQFSEIDISGANITINSGDFFYAFAQPVAQNYLLGFDTDGVNADRAWVSFDGVNWQKLSPFGFPFNFVVRAIVQEGTGKNARIVEISSNGERRPVDIAELKANMAIGQQSFIMRPVKGKKQSVAEKVSALQSYNVYRSDDGGSTFNLLANVPATQNAYSDGNVTPPTTYHYYVTAQYDEGESAPSNVASAAPALAPEAFNDHVTTDILASVTNEGNIGFLNGFPGQGGIGNGFQFNPRSTSGQRLFEGSIMIATDSMHVSDNARDENQVFDADFQAVSGFDTTVTGNVFELNTKYNDDTAENPLGLLVTQNSVSVDEAGSNRIVLFELDLTNNSGASLSDVKVGAFFDWDVDAATAADRGSVVVDSTNTIPGVNGGNPFPIEVVEMHSGNAWVGVVPLSASVFGARRIAVSADEVYPPRMTDGDKWKYMTQNRATNPNGDGGSAQDHAQVFGLPAVNVDAGATQRVGFAIVAGQNLDELMAAARRAQQIWVERGNNIDILVGIGDDVAGLPTQYSLEQNYPNPFNPSTTLKYALPTNADVRLEIYNVLGQLVKVLVNEKQTAGFKTAIWDGTNQVGEKVASGIYIYRLKAADYVQSKKMILMK